MTRIILSINHYWRTEKSKCGYIYKYHHDLSLLYSLKSQSFVSIVRVFKEFFRYTDPCL